MGRRPSRVRSEPKKKHEQVPRRKKRLFSFATESWTPAQVKKIIKETGMGSTDKLAQEIGVTPVTICRWLESDPRFIEAYKEGAHLFWEKVAKTMLECYSQGYSNHEVAHALDITMDTYQKWVKRGDNELITEAYKLGRTLCRAWYEREARENRFNTKLNTGIFIWMMKVNFGMFDNLMIQEFEKDRADKADTDIETQSIEIRLKKMITREIRPDQNEPLQLEGPGKKED